MLMVTEYHSGVWKQLGQKPSPAVNNSYRVILLGVETAPPLRGDKKSNPYRKKTLPSHHHHDQHDHVLTCFV